MRHSRRGSCVIEPVDERGLGRSKGEQVDPYRVATLGERTIASPLGLASTRTETSSYVPDGTRILDQVEIAPGASVDVGRAFEKAGPRELIYFAPGRTRAGIVTSGGLCPGINDVIRALVLELVHKYGIRSVLGFRYGFGGLDPACSVEPLELGVDQVRHIHARGGTILGTSRGAHAPKVMVDTLVERGIDLLFAIGGDGTMRGAHAIAEEAERRGARIAVIGVPKTIDNDIPFVDKTFGFETAVAMARTAIDAAHTEALSVQNGIGLVKLMGRESGFIAAHATIASHDVNVCLIPEVPFRLEGPRGLLGHLERRLAERGHAVIVVAEGCGSDLVSGADAPRDRSGNLRFEAAELDIGKHLLSAIGRFFEDKAIATTFKYIDPSYMLRGIPAGAVDAVFCSELARHAVHAAMAGMTDMMVGRLHRAFTHVPLRLVLGERKRIDPCGDLWLGVTESTGQPRFI
jgi:6-phosphofructokinase 1